MMPAIFATIESDPASQLPAPSGPTDGEERRRAARIVQLRDRHWSMLWLSLAIVASAFLLRVDASGSVAWGPFPGANLPSICASRIWLGIECPGCGLTRSFIALAHGDLAASLAYHRVGWALALAVLLQFPYRAFALRELNSGLVERTWPQWIGWALIPVLLGSWLGKITGLF